MKFTSYTLTKVASVALAGVFLACGSSKTEEASGSDEFTKADEEVVDDIDRVLHDLPSPAEVPYTIEATGAEFDMSLINTLDNVKTYTDNNEVAAINLGIYVADIGYLASYSQSQEALNYLNDGVKPLAEQLDINNAFDMQVLKSFESNLDNRDSLAHIIDRAINRAQDYLEAMNRNKLVVEVLAGSFIEGIYISTQIVDTYPGQGLTEEQVAIVLTPLVRVILEQEKSLDELLGLLNDIQNKGQMLEQLTADLTDLKASYEELNIEDAIANNQSELLLTNKTLRSIAAKVREIRRTVVS